MKKRDIVVGAIILSTSMCSGMERYTPSPLEENEKENLKQLVIRFLGESKALLGRPVESGGDGGAYEQYENIQTQVAQFLADLNNNKLSGSDIMNKLCEIEESGPGQCQLVEKATHEMRFLKGASRADE